MGTVIKFLFVTQPNLAREKKIDREPIFTL